MGINEKLSAIQTELKAPKNLYNSFGKYKYRNLEGICEAVKPLLKAQGCTLVISDSIEAVGNRIYVKATAVITDTESNESITVSAFAREQENKKGMDDPQVTGTASSYARKYCLNGLFLIDDTKDPDTEEYKEESEARSAVVYATDVQIEALKKMLAKNGKTEKDALAKAGIRTMKKVTAEQYNTMARFAMGE